MSAATVVLLAGILLVQLDHSYGILARPRTSRLGRAVLNWFSRRT